MRKKILKVLTVVAIVFCTTFSFAQIGNVESLSPANGAVNVSADTDLVIVVEGDYASSGTGGVAFFLDNSQIFFIGANGNANGTVNFVYDGSENTTVTINLTNNLPTGNISVNVQNAIFGGTNGGDIPDTGSLVAKANWAFTTVPLTGDVISLFPENGATNVDLTGNPDLVMVIKGEIGKGNDNNGDVFIRPVANSNMPQTRIDADGIDPHGTVTFSYNAGADETTVTIAPITLDFGAAATGDIAIRILGSNNGLQGTGSDAGFSFGGDVISFGDWTFSYDPLTLSTTVVSKLQARVYGENGTITVLGANLEAVYNITGQQVSNQGLASGIYIVKVSKNDQVATVKVAVK
ncbi:T9SS type A sorting domain-containing protein [Tamlana sp. 2201CG12-4]|uniref:T9SS type A sorting domain-containing protein n=1 Tax=Tamlana sp. 2201CG12-4 TaxID=3112582 RepID=UPI002DB81781|nr:T9SS type A sorting domain-containing protein [Tamlana sp. 2201CG12-4]MEC3908656.1 T9SS type A sorting domain-containing protein [Tamlana sp. 2201CG12-4]